MKNVLKISILNLLMIHVTMPAGAALPQHWLKPESRQPLSPAQRLSSLGASKFFQSNEGEAARDFDKYFSATDVLAQSGMIQNSRRTRKPWYLQSLKAELGVEASGELGFMGMGGEGAVELIWTRNPVVVAKLVDEARQNGKLSSASPLALRPLLDATEAAEIQGNEPGVADAAFDTSMSTRDLERQVDDVVAGLAMHPRQKGTAMRITDLGRVRRELLVQFARIQPALVALAAAPEEWTWRPYKFQLELFVEAAGRVAPVVEVGAVTRLRLEWNITPGKPATAPEAKPLSGIAQLVREMDALDQPGLPDRIPFQLSAFKAGVGFGTEMDLAVAELKGHAIGSVFFKRKPKSQGGSTGGREATPLKVLSNEGQPVSIPAEKFSRGIRRASEIVAAITQRAARHEARQVRSGKVRQFELGAIEVELALEAEGDLFLPTVSKQASLELFFVRGGSLGGGSN